MRFCQIYISMQVFLRDEMKGVIKVKIYDISQEFFSGEVYPGDPAPEKKAVYSMDNGDLYNLTAFSASSHSGTHLDAPKHFINDGTSVSEIPLYKTVGYCLVAECDGEIGKSEAEAILEKAEKEKPDAKYRILIKGTGVLNADGAKVLADRGIYLIGSESQSVGDINAPMAVHLALLSKEVVLLEGIRLSEVSEGVYFLSAQPLKMAETDGAPVRAILIK